MIARLDQHQKGVIRPSFLEWSRARAEHRQERRKEGKGQNWAHVRRQLGLLHRHFSLWPPPIAGVEEEGSKEGAKARKKDVTGTSSFTNGRDKPPRLFRPTGSAWRCFDLAQTQDRTGRFDRTDTDTATDRQHTGSIFGTGQGHNFFFFSSFLLSHHPSPLSFLTLAMSSIQTQASVAPTGAALYARFALAGAICCGVTHGALTPVGKLMFRFLIHSVGFRSIWPSFCGSSIKTPVHCTL